MGESDGLKTCCSGRRRSLQWDQHTTRKHQSCVYLELVLVVAMVVSAAGGAGSGLWLRLYQRECCCCSAGTSRVGGEGLRRGGVVQAHFPDPPPPGGSRDGSPGRAHRGLGFQGTPTHIPQNDHHVALIILRYISWGAIYFPTFSVQATLQPHF